MFCIHKSCMYALVHDAVMSITIAFLLLLLFFFWQISISARKRTFSVPYFSLFTCFAIPFWKPLEFYSLYTVNDLNPNKDQTFFEALICFNFPTQFENTSFIFLLMQVTAKHTYQSSLIIDSNSFELEIIYSLQ